MTGTTPTERIVEILQTVGYKNLPMPLVVAGIAFAFSAVLVGTGKTADLVVVADTTEEKDSRILQRIEGLARALDALSSVRPLTLVVAGTRPSTSMLDSMAGVCRVLVAESAASGAEIRRGLSVLLPLDLPPLKNPVTDISSVMQFHENEDPLTMQFLESASRGTEDVKQLLFQLLSEPFLDDASGVETV